METNFYIRIDGNDDNDGLEDNAEHAFRTLQGAVDKYQLRYKPSPYDVYFRMTVAGEYNPTNTPISVNGNAIGNTVNITGIPGSQNDTTLTSIGSVIVFESGGGSISDVKCVITQSTSWAGCVLHKGSSNLFVSNITAQRTVSTQNNSFVIKGLNVFVSGTINVSGNWSFILNCEEIRSTTFNLNGASAGIFLNTEFFQFVEVNRSVYSITFTGSYNIGYKFWLNEFSKIRTYGAGVNFFPGSTAGYFADTSICKYS